MPIQFILLLRRLTPYIKKFWKESIIILIILMGYWKYNNMIRTIEYQKEIIFQDNVIINNLKSNERVLQDAVASQNTKISILEELSNKQSNRIREAEKQSDKIRSKFRKEIDEILLTKPKNITSCEENMKWLVDKSGDFRWK